MSTDPRAAPGTWRLWYRSGWNSDAIGGDYDALPFNGGNPQVVFCRPLGCYLAIVSEWSEPVKVTFMVSNDGISFGNPKKVDLVQRNGYMPSYPSAVSSTGGSYWLEGTNKIYYSDMTSGNVRIPT